MINKKLFYVAYSNSDLTEGRGYDIPIAVCELEATAIRRAHKQYVQGTNGPVRSFDAIELDSRWYLPIQVTDVIKPSEEDKKVQKRLDEKRSAIERAKISGLTEADINILINSK